MQQVLLHPAPRQKCANRIGIWKVLDDPAKRTENGKAGARAEEGYEEGGEEGIGETSPAELKRESSEEEERRFRGVHEPSEQTRRQGPGGSTIIHRFNIVLKRLSIHSSTLSLFATLGWRLDLIGRIGWRQPSD